MKVPSSIVYADDYASSVPFQRSPLGSFSGGVTAMDTMLERASRQNCEMSDAHKIDVCLFLEARLDCPHVTSLYRYRRNDDPNT